MSNYKNVGTKGEYMPKVEDMEGVAVLEERCCLVQTGPKPTRRLNNLEL